MNFKHPFRSFIIILVGKSHCLEAVTNLKEMSICLTKLLSQQCKVHTSQKLRETLRLYSYYTRIWGDEMAKQMFSKMRRSLVNSGKYFLLSAVCMTPYDWKNYKIPDENLDSCVSEYDNVSDLCNATVCCEECHKRQVFDSKINNVDYCMCKGSLGYTGRNRTYDSWEPFLERENILVWRKKHQKFNHLYCYKVFGTYSDMSLNAFMEVQLNTSFRTQWDSSALELKVIDSDAESNSALLYWLVRFPHFFANRDYVFKRRYKVNAAKKEVVIYNEIAEVSQIPEENRIYRVKDYWSVMVLRANESFDKPGMSYTLTYFDNPGTSLPATVTNFVASTAFPDFLNKVYKAAMSLQRRWEKGEDVYVTLPDNLRYLRRWADGDDIREHPSLESMPDAKKRAVREVLHLDENVDEATQEKLAIRFRRVVIDLLEAIEVVSPEYGERSILMEKIEAFVDKLGIKNGRKQKLVKKLEKISDKTKLFMQEAAEKKEESFKIMNEIEKRHYYDHDDEPTLVHFQDLLQAINEIMKIDKERRIGKDLTRPDSRYVKKRLKSPEIQTETPLESSRLKSPEIQTETPLESSTENFMNGNIINREPITCECCANSDFYVTENWYSHFVVLLGLHSENKMSKANCVCKHSLAVGENKSSVSNLEGMKIERTSESRENASLRSSVYALFRTESESHESSDKADGDDSINESVPWYFFSWIFKIFV